MATHAKSVESVGDADIAVCASNGDVEKAIALAEAGFKQVGGLELVATLVLCGDLERRHHGGRQAAIVFLDAGGHGVEQQRCLHGLSGWDQRRSEDRKSTRLNSSH